MAHQDSRQGFGVVELVIFIAVIGIVAVLAVPGLLSYQRPSRERHFSSSLKTLASAEADFRANDRDWNHVNDFWTADVKGLYTMTSAAVAGGQPNRTTDPSIKLIELSVASADADGTFHSAGGENIDLNQFAVPSAKAGYWFAAFDADLSLAPGDPDRLYRQDTGGKPVMGKVHHQTKFGFVAFPDSQSAGKYVAILNENNTIFRAAVTAPIRRGTATPPGLATVPPAYLNWPDDAALKASWFKID